MQSIEDIEVLRKAMLVYAQEVPEDEIFQRDSDNLVSFVSKNLGRDITESDLRGALYRDMPAYADVSNAGKCFVVQDDEESICRLTIVLGKSPLEMELDELESNAIKLFTRPTEEYAQLARAHGFNTDSSARDEFHNCTVDATLLFGVLAKRTDQPFTVDYVLERLPELGNHLGKFKQVFDGKLEQKFEFEKPKMSYLLYQMIQGLYNYASHQMRAHETALARLESSHLLSSPELIRTLELSLMPCAISFTEYGDLAVLGISKDAAEGDKKLMLAIYDVTGEGYTQITQTDLDARFPGMGAEFLGSLTTGSDGLLYACGNLNLERFDGDLEEVPLERGGLKDAIEEIKRINLFLPEQLHQVVEKDGEFYFVLQDPIEDKFPESKLYLPHPGVIRRIIPRRSTNISECEHFLRVSIYGSKAYFVKNGSVSTLALNGESDFETILGPEGLADSYVPSNLTVDEQGMLWVVTKQLDEVVASVKCYIADKVPQFVTHISLPNLNHFPALDDVAISQTGLLAYSDHARNQVHIYQLK
jgi:hypothetical protein